MDAPTADYVRSASRVDFEALGWGEVTAPDVDRLQEELEAILPWIEDVTGYYFGASLPQGFNPNGQSIPVRKEPIYRKAVRMALEWEAYRQHPDQVEGIIDIDYLASMTAGSYSETRRSVTEIQRIEDQIHPWPELNSLLTGLRGPFLGDGHEVPVVGVTDPHYRGGADIMATHSFPYVRGSYDPYDMRNFHITVRSPSTFDPVNEHDIQITGLPNG